MAKAASGKKLHGTQKDQKRAIRHKAALMSNEKVLGCRR